MRLDPLDRQIVDLLRGDARLSFREIAERVGSTTPTVSARVKTLEDLGIMRGYHAEVDHGILGGTSYIVALSVQPQHARETHAALVALPGVHRTHLLAGGRIVAHVHLRPPAFGLRELHDKLAELPGLQTYDASEVLEGRDQAPIVELPEHVDVPCHQCQGPIHGDPHRARFGERTHVFCCKMCSSAFREKYELRLSGAKAARKPMPVTEK